MAMSSEAFQEVETATCMLSGTSSLTSRLSRVCLVVLFCVRCGLLLVGCRTIWQDEEKNFICNSTRILCKPSCFDEFSPISSFNLFSLQTVALVTHAMCVAFLTRSGYQAKEGWLHAQLRRKTVQMKLHILGLISRILIEGLFILTFYKVTEGFIHRRTIHCHTAMCEPFVFCTDINSTIKNVFSLCMCAASAASVMICAWELLNCLPSNQHKNDSSKPSSKKTHF
ncbi:gap junction beta-1 protein-like [Hyperolius riggenbachi]|uniref:gap junction beta-1 protein-like n=1 Tax=Hyperolius riggenbachi TaxID=752182 RepID=UPI0035A30312